MSTRTVINHLGGSINIDGKVYEHIQGSITITNEGIIVNGKPLKEYKEPTIVKLTVVGNVESIDSENSDVTVEGEVNTVTTKNGNVNVKGNVTNNVESKNGNINIHGSVGGDVTTKNGNVMY